MKVGGVTATLILAGLSGAGCALIAPFPDLAPDPSGGCEGAACYGAHVLSAGFGDDAEQRGSAVAASDDGAVLAAFASGAIDLGGGALSELGNSSKPDCVIASFAEGGEHRWSRRFADCVARGVAVAVGGDVVLAGSADGKVDFGGGALNGGNEDVVIARLDADGGHRWSRRFGGGQAQLATAVAVDAAGNAVVTGTFWGKLDFGAQGGPPDEHALASAGESDGFVVKLDADGEVQWARRFGDALYHQAGTAVAVDGKGNIVLAGWFKGTLGLGGDEEAVSESDMFVAKLAPGGEVLWRRAARATSAGKALGVAIDGAGNVLVAGSFRGELAVGKTTLTNAGDKDAVVIKLDENGAPLWAKAFGDGADQEALGVSTDPEGNVLVTGVFLGGVELGGTRLEASGAADGFLTKLAPGGDVLWARSFGDGSEQGSAAVDADPLGNVWATGYFGGAVDFGGGPLRSSGASDVFLVELAP